MNFLLSGIKNKGTKLSLRYKNKDVPGTLPGILNSKPFPLMNGLGNFEIINSAKEMTGRDICCQT